MVGLLDLPLELREPILLDVVVDTMQQQPEQRPSLSEVDNGGYRSVEVADHDPGAVPDDRAFCKSLNRHAMQLLHINQQIRDEVIDIVLRKLGQRIDDAKLNITFDFNPESMLPSTLWATWLSAPFPTFHMNTVHAQLRLFQVMGFRASGHITPSWNDMGDCVEWIDSHVAGMLLSFVETSVRTQAGTASVHERQRTTTTKRSRSSYRTIQKLVFDIPVDPHIQNSREGLVRCLICPGAPSLSEGEFFCMIPSGKRAAFVFAKYLHEKLLEIFNKVGGPFYDTAVPRLIFERVGMIELNVCGRLFGHVNLGQILATVPHTEDWFTTDLTRTEFFKWKRAAEDKRNAAGFKPVNASAQECHLAGRAGLIGSILAARDDSILGDAFGSSEENAQTAGQPAAGEQVAFTGKAVLIHDDGSKLPGDAIFYCPSNISWDNNHHVGPGLDLPPQPFSRWGFSLPTYAHKKIICQQSELVEGHIGERPQMGELVLFKGEAIVFPAQPRETIISGEAIFYGRAVRAKQLPGST